MGAATKSRSWLDVGLGLRRLLGQEDGVDAGENAALGDGDTVEDLGQLVVIEDGQLEVPRDDPGLLIVPGSVAGQLKDLGSEILQDGGHVDTGALLGPLGVVALLQQLVAARHGELEAGLLGGVDPGLQGPGLPRRRQLGLQLLANSLLLLGGHGHLEVGGDGSCRSDGLLATGGIVRESALFIAFNSSLY